MLIWELKYFYLRLTAVANLSVIYVKKSTTQVEERNRFWSCFFHSDEN